MAKTKSNYKVQDAILHLHYQTTEGKTKLLSPTERLLLLKLYNLSAKQGYAFCSNEYLSEFLGLKDSQTRKILKSLDDNDFIRRDTINTSANSKKRKIFICFDKILPNNSISENAEIADTSDTELDTIGDQDSDSESVSKVANPYSVDDFIKEITEEFNYNTLAGVKHTRNLINKLCKDNSIKATELAESFDKHSANIIDIIESKELTGVDAIRYLMHVTMNKIGESEDEYKSAATELEEFKYNNLMTGQEKFFKLVLDRYGIDCNDNSLQQVKDIQAYFKACKETYDSLDFEWWFNWMKSTVKKPSLSVVDDMKFTFKTNVEDVSQEDIDTMNQMEQFYKNQQIYSSTIESPVRVIKINKNPFDEDSKTNNITSLSTRPIDVDDIDEIINGF